MRIAVRFGRLAQIKKHFWNSESCFFCQSSHTVPDHQWQGSDHCKHVAVHHKPHCNSLHPTLKNVKCHQSIEYWCFKSNAFGNNFPNYSWTLQASTCWVTGNILSGRKSAVQWNPDPGTWRETNTRCINLQGNTQAMWLIHAWKRDLDRKTKQYIDISGYIQLLSTMLWQVCGVITRFMIYTENKNVEYIYLSIEGFVS